MRKFIPVLLIIFSFFISADLSAQDLLSAKDLSTVKVDDLSEEDVAQLQAELKAKNVTVAQLEPMVLSKGMSSSEFNKLKKRLESSLPTKTKEPVGRSQEKVLNSKEKDSTDQEIFGSELFDKPTLDFQPNLQLATPVNYILGPGDELQVSVYGVQEYNESLPVSVEGKVNARNVGQVAVAGMPIEAATEKIRSAFSRIYSTLRSGQSQLSVSLNRIRTIKVTIIGSRLPGNYSLSSLSTVYNALYLGGGPAANGSYRNIELIRNNKVFSYVDIYKFLVNGNQSGNIGLKDNDVIRIPAYSHRVTVKGEVNRPGIFELKQGETFNDLLSFAAGFDASAYRAAVNVIQKTSKELKVTDIKSSEFGTYTPQPGDEFTVSKILNRFENRISIEGAVFRPNTYSFYEGMRIADLLAKAEGLKEDAYIKRATIVRLKDDLTMEILNVNLERAVAGDAAANIGLKREDKVKVYSILDFKEEYQITINGEVNKPGTYEYHDNLTLNDLLMEAGGLMVSAARRVEVARMIQAQEIDNNPAKVQLFNIEIDPASNEQVKNFKLEPFDVINVRKMPVYEKPQSVLIKGAVAYPGSYVLSNKSEKLYDVIQRAGGLTSVADPNGVKIKRPIGAKQIEALDDVNLNLGKGDTVQNKLTRRLEEIQYATIPVELEKIIRDPKHNTNITLLPEDEIEVSLYTENVKVRGNVLLTSEIPYVSGKGFNYYLDAVGGLDSKAWKKKAYIIYPNGKASVTSNFLFFKSYPKVTPGSQIVVPEKPETKKVSIGEIVSIASVLVGMAGVVIAITR
ncbi:MAG: SLBB domain-containing protein [Bacteroidota bacterium]